MTEIDLIKKLQTLKTVETDQEWLVCARKRMLDLSESKGAETQLFGVVFSGFSFRIVTAVAGFLLIAGASGTLALASNSLPGDPLYNVKLASEGFQNSLPASPIAQAQRQEASAQRRVNELAQVIQNINTFPSVDKKGLAPAVDQQIRSYNQALQQNAQVLSESSNAGQSQSIDIAKVKDEVSIIQQSAQTLAIVLHQADNSADLEKALRATVGNRLPLCKDQQMLSQVQKLLSSDEIADLVTANELSVRCVEGN